MRPLVGLTLCLALVASACAGETARVPIGVDEYVASLDQVAVEFDESLTESSELDYPIEGELVGATGVFESYGGALAGLRTIARRLRRRIAMANSSLHSRPCRPRSPTT